MKERWPEMLEYQQEVQAMQADIDRLLESLRLAEEEIDEWRGKLAEQCGKTLAAAAEMRERAAQEVEWKTDDPYIAIAIRALPLTPEEPT